MRSPSSPGPAASGNLSIQGLDTARGVRTMEEAKQWLLSRGIEDIECITPDIAGVVRGKMMPSTKFLSDTKLALPSSVFMQTISGDWPEESNTVEYPANDGDHRLIADLSTLCSVPWESDPTEQVICDLQTHRGDMVPYAPRNVLRKVLAAYEA